MRQYLTIVILGLAGCSSGLLEASTEPPTGIDVALTTSFSAGIVPTTGSVVGKGDSLVAIVTRPATCGRTLSADAGTKGTELIVTIILFVGAGVCAMMGKKKFAAVQFVPTESVEQIKTDIETIKNDIARARSSR
jgi:hypothetical protein